MKIFLLIGEYLILMRRVFRRPEKRSIFMTQLLHEMDKLGIDSLGIVAIISVFMGAVAAIQTAYSIDGPLIPLYTVGFTVRTSIIAEFSPTIISLILAGKVGSRIASEIGTMRITEQIDALEIMGVNSANYLIFPKVIAAVLINPILIIISMFLGIFGGWLAAVITGIVTSHNYIWGVQIDFRMYSVFYALTKTIVFAFIITSGSGFHGYRVRGGAIEVGNASTKAVVQSSIYIILFNLILTQLFLS